MIIISKKMEAWLVLNHKSIHIFYQHSYSQILCQDIEKMKWPEYKLIYIIVEHFLWQIAS